MPATAAPPSPKTQFLDVYKREHATTMKVLRAFPADRGDFKPHDRSNSALQLAWTFVIENNISIAALNGPLKLGGGFPPAPPLLADAIAAYESSAKELIATLERTPDSRLGETIQFPTGAKSMGEFPVIEFLWFMQMDAVHHRGQLSVYVRMAGGKVPSIYGPSADEPWS
jgi:uncharacterized damage-inducible protein DinB